MVDRKVSPGKVFAGDYWIVRTLLDDDTSTVYAVRQLSQNRVVSLEVIDASVMDGALDVERLTAEVSAAAAIDVPHVARILEAGVEGDAPWIVMDPFEGEALAVMLGRGRRMPLGEALDILRPIAATVEAIHARGAVHLDLRPDRIVLAPPSSADEPSAVRLMRIGLPVTMRARRMGAHRIAWLAPEVLSGAIAPDPSADVWSFGLLAFHMLSGHRYWNEVGAEALLHEVLEGPIPSARERCYPRLNTIHLPPGFDAWFARCVARAPAARFPGVGEACRALAAEAQPG